MAYTSDSQLGKELLRMAEKMRENTPLKIKSKTCVEGAERADRIIRKLRDSAAGKKPLYLLKLMKGSILTRDEVILLAEALDGGIEDIILSIEKDRSPRGGALAKSSGYFSGAVMRMKLAQLLSGESRLVGNGIISRAGNIDQTLGARLLGIKVKEPGGRKKRKKKLRAAGIKEQLDRRIVGQERAKAVIATAAEGYIRGGEGGFPNILMIGPTGSGKTCIIRTLAEILDIPVVITDATRYSETGYAGDDTSDILHTLVKDEKYAESEGAGIVYIDEIDKIAHTPHRTRDVSGRSVQEDLLKFLDSRKVQSGGNPFMRRSRFEVDTSKVLFVCGGSFAALGRDTRPVTGFTAPRGGTADSGEITSERLVEFGMIPELLGRLPVRVFFEKLGAEELKTILNDPDISPVRQLSRLLPEEARPGKIPEEVLDIIASEAARMGLGARGLVAAFEKHFAGILYSGFTEMRGTPLKARG